MRRFLSRTDTGTLVKPLAELEASDVAHLLSELKLSLYKSAFEDLSGPDLGILTDDDAEEMITNKIHRRRFLAELAKFREKGVPLSKLPGYSSKLEQLRSWGSSKLGMSGSTKSVAR